MDEHSKHKEWMKGSPFFQAFSDSEIEDLVKEKTCFLKYSKGEGIIMKGDREDTLFVLLDGTAIVTKGVNKEFILTTLERGSVFGEMSLLLRKSRTTNILAQTNVVVWKINTESLNVLNMEIQNLIKGKIVGFLVQRLNDMNDKFIKLSNERKTNKPVTR